MTGHDETARELGTTSGIARVVPLRPRAAAAPAARLLVAGDLCLAPGAAADGAAHPWGALGAFIGGYDMALVNLECPLGAGDAAAKAGPRLCGDPALAGTIAAGRFTAVSLANNHIMDGGRRGLEATLAACADAGLATVGAGTDLAAANAALRADLGGLRVAVLAFAEREFSIAGQDAPGAAPLGGWASPALVRAAAAEADVVLAIVHGGNEYYGLPRPGLVAACRALVEAGAHAVVCHHAHVPLPYEVHEGAPVVYGVGNLLFPARRPQPPAWHLGYLVGLEVSAAGVHELTLVPYAQTRHGLAASPLSRDEAARFFAELDRLAAVLADDDALAAAWRRFCARRRPYIVAAALGLTRAERLLLRAGLWPSWRLPRSRLAEAVDMLSCDSHREVLESLLREELAREA